MKIFYKLARFSFVVKSTVGRLIAELSFSAPPSIFISIYYKMLLIKLSVEDFYFVLLKLVFTGTLYVRRMVEMELQFGLQMPSKCGGQCFYLNRKDGRSIDRLSHGKLAHPNLISIMYKEGLFRLFTNFSEITNYEAKKVW